MSARPVPAPRALLATPSSRRRAARSRASCAGSGSAPRCSWCLWLLGAGAAARVRRHPPRRRARSPGAASSPAAPGIRRRWALWLLLLVLFLLIADRRLDGGQQRAPGPRRHARREPAGAVRHLCAPRSPAPSGAAPCCSGWAIRLELRGTRAWRRAWPRPPRSGIIPTGAVLLFAAALYFALSRRPALRPRRSCACCRNPGARAAAHGVAMGETLTWWFLGQLIDMAVIGSLTFAGLLGSGCRWRARWR